MHRYKEDQIAEVSEALEKERNDLDMYKRLQVLLWRMKGVSMRKVMTESGFSQNKVWRICDGYRNHGLEGLLLQYGNCGGSNRKLSQEEEAAALKRLSDKATSGGFVRISELKAAFEADTKTVYHWRTFYALLERHKWRKVMPRGSHPKRPPAEEAEASKKLTLKSEH